MIFKVIIEIRFDFFTLAKQFNELAKEKGWAMIDNPENLVHVWTQIPCKHKEISFEQLNMKVSQKRPDNFLLEYD